MGRRIQRSEWMYLFLAVLSIGCVVALINVPELTARISSLNPIWQFLLINLGLYASLFLIAKSVALRKSSWKLTKATLGGLCLWLALDTIFPEFHVNLQGLQVGGIFGASATDYFFGYLYQQVLDLSGWALVVAVYVVTPVALLVTAAYLIKNFIRTL